MAEISECVINSIIKSINDRRVIDLSKCEDDRNASKLKEGDVIAGLWYNDPNYYAGKLEKMGSGELGIPIEEDIVGLVNDAHHIVKINKKC